jgi:hypothetical protein
MTPTVRRVEIPHATTLSPYIRFGDTVSRLALFITSVCVVWAIGWMVQRPGR